VTLAVPLLCALAGYEAYREPIATSAPEFQIRRAQAHDAPVCARLQVIDRDREVWMAGADRT
jgi:hypothetical protein